LQGAGGACVAEVLFYQLVLEVVVQLAEGDGADGDELRCAKLVTTTASIVYEKTCDNRG